MSNVCALKVYQVYKTWNIIHNEKSSVNSYVISPQAKEISLDELWVPRTTIKKCDNNVTWNPVTSPARRSQTVTQILSQRIVWLVSGLKKYPAASMQNAQGALLHLYFKTFQQSICSESLSLPPKVSDANITDMTFEQFIQIPVNANIFYSSLKL